MFNRICFGAFNFFFLFILLFFFLDLTFLEFILICGFIYVILVFGLFPGYIVDNCTYYITNFVV